VNIDRDSSPQQNDTCGSGEQKRLGYNKHLQNIIAIWLMIDWDLINMSELYPLLAIRFVLCLVSRAEFAGTGKRDSFCRVRIFAYLRLNLLS